MTSMKTMMMTTKVSCKEMTTLWVARIGVQSKERYPFSHSQIISRLDRDALKQPTSFML